MIIRRKYLRLLLVIVALLALGLRSLIPVGYMPDFSGHGKGLFPIIICDGYEPVTNDGMDDDCPMHHHSHNGHWHLCPFGMGALFTFVTLLAALEVSLTYITMLTTRHVVPQLLGRQQAFTNASPRSPPFFS